VLLDHHAARLAKRKAGTSRSASPARMDRASLKKQADPSRRKRSKPPPFLKAASVFALLHDAALVRAAGQAACNQRETES
jgi:hypothetical protein